MVSPLNLEEKYNRVRRNFCFYLDVQDHGLARSLSRRLQDMGLQQEVFLTSRVTHVVSDGGGGGGGGGGARAARALRCNGGRRADAMLERARAQPHAHHPRLVRLSVYKAICLLDKLYDTFFTDPRRWHFKLFTKHYIKIEFLDKVCRPVFKEFDEWPDISLERDPPKKDRKNSTTTNQATNDINQNQQDPIQKMTRKSRPRIKEKEEQKGGYCEMCNVDYVDVALHRRSPHHLAFVRDHTNFLALDSLITSGTDVATFLDKQAINGERRSLRKMCNGDVEQKPKRSKRSQSPDSTVNGNQSPKRNGGLDDEKRHNTRCSKRSAEDDRQYYKVVGVSTKLRSSGGFATKRKDSPPTCNGAKPLVVKFRKVRRSELSVLSDEAEQFMFPKRASSTSSTSSDEEEKEVLSPRRKTPPQPQPTPAMERRRLARPVALKEESSEEDGWPEDKRRRKRRACHPPVKRGRRVPLRQSLAQPEPVAEIKPAPEEAAAVTATEPAVEEVNPLRDDASERCMKWEDGKLTYTPAVEQLEFAFESVPKSEPWFETFKRQDEDRVLTRNVPKYFALYAKSPKLPYEIGQLPPLKPNCCPLSDLVKREEKAGPSRSYGTRGMKKQKFRKRTAALIALEGHPRKSPREHASTLAILGSAGLLQRRKHDDAKSTASEDTISDTHSHLKLEPVLSEAIEASERLKQFLSEVFEDAAEYEVSEEAMEGEAALTTSTNLPDVSSLVLDCEDCDIIRNEMKEGAEARARGRRGKFKKKNRTGWPNKKKAKKESRTDSVESQKQESSLDRSSAEPPDEDTQDTISEEDPNLSETDNDKTVIELKHSDEAVCEPELMETPSTRKRKHEETRPSRSSLSECASDEREERKKKKRALAGLLLQPVVKVTRVDPSAARRLRSAGKQRSGRLR